MINAIECNYNIKTGTFIQLSSQQIVDCDPLTNWCNGGSDQGVALYRKSFRLMRDSDYPYTGAQGTCAYNTAQTGNYLDGLEYIQS
jgi:hypothetical protein